MSPKCRSQLPRWTSLLLLPLLMFRWLLSLVAVEEASDSCLACVCACRYLSLSPLDTSSGSGRNIIFLSSAAPYSNISIKICTWRLIISTIRSSSCSQAPKRMYSWMRITLHCMHVHLVATPTPPRRPLLAWLVVIHANLHASKLPAGTHACTTAYAHAWCKVFYLRKASCELRMLVEEDKCSNNLPGSIHDRSCQYTASLLLRFLIKLGVKTRILHTYSRRNSSTTCTCSTRSSTRCTRSNSSSGRCTRTNSSNGKCTATNNNSSIMQKARNSVKQRWLQAKASLWAGVETSNQ